MEPVLLGLGLRLGLSEPGAALVCVAGCALPATLLVVLGEDRSTTDLFTRVLPSKHGKRKVQSGESDAGQAGVILRADLIPRSVPSSVPLSGEQSILVLAITFRT